jgi:hypothetical protein
MTARNPSSAMPSLAIGLGVQKNEMGHSSDVRLDGCRLRDRTVGTVWFVGLAGMIGEKIGLPPGWTDRGAPVPEPPQPVIGPTPRRQAAR